MPTCGRGGIEVEVAASSGCDNKEARSWRRQQGLEMIAAGCYIGGLLPAINLQLQLQPSIAMPKLLLPSCLIVLVEVACAEEVGSSGR